MHRTSVLLPWPRPAPVAHPVTRWRCARSPVPRDDARPLVRCAYARPPRPSARCGPEHEAPVAVARPTSALSTIRDMDEGQGRNRWPDGLRCGRQGPDLAPTWRPDMATIDELVYPDAQQESDSEHLRARAHQTLRLLRAPEIAAFQEFGGSDRLLVASSMGIHEFSYRPAPDDPMENTVSHTLTRWPNVKGVEMALRYRARRQHPLRRPRERPRTQLPGLRQRDDGRQRAADRLRQHLRGRDRALPGPLTWSRWPAAAIASAAILSGGYRRECLEVGRHLVAQAQPVSRSGRRR